MSAITETITFNFHSEQQRKRFHEKLSGADQSDALKDAKEIIAGFLLWHDPAYKPSPRESLEGLVSGAREFLAKQAPPCNQHECIYEDGAGYICRHCGADMDDEE